MSNIRWLWVILGAIATFASLAEAQEQASFGDLEGWSLYSSQAARAIQQVYAELDGELDGATP